MAVQVGRTVISFTIKYVQSERDKLKSDVSKVLDSKNKAIKERQRGPRLSPSAGAGGGKGANVAAAKLAKKAGPKLSWLEKCALCPGACPQGLQCGKCQRVPASAWDHRNAPKGKWGKRGK